MRVISGRVPKRTGGPQLPVPVALDSPVERRHDPNEEKGNRQREAQPLGKPRRVIRVGEREERRDDEEEGLKEAPHFGNVLGPLEFHPNGPRHPYC